MDKNFVCWQLWETAWASVEFLQIQINSKRTMAWPHPLPPPHLPQLKEKLNAV